MSVNEIILAVVDAAVNAVQATVPSRVNLDGTVEHRQADVIARLRAPAFAAQLAASLVPASQPNGDNK